MGSNSIIRPLTVSHHGCDRPILETPSMSILSEPIIQSTCMFDVLPPASFTLSGLFPMWSLKHLEYTAQVRYGNLRFHHRVYCRIAILIRLLEMNAGRGRPPKRRAPSSVSRRLRKTSSPLSALAFVIFPSRTQPRCRQSRFHDRPMAS